MEVNVDDSPTNVLQPRRRACSTRNGGSTSKDPEIDSSIIPGLPDDVAKYCLALVPRSSFPYMGAVCKKWRSFIQSRELLTTRKLAGVSEEWLYILTADGEWEVRSWEVFDGAGRKQQQQIPPMPGLVKAGFGVVVSNGKLLVIGGYSAVEGTRHASAEVYQYDPCINSWSRLANTNEARYSFACAEVNGMVYVAGGRGLHHEGLSSAETYNPVTKTWSFIKNLRLPRWDCFAHCLKGKLYLLGGRSNFTIGNSRSICIYDPNEHTWCEMKNGCVAVTAHADLEGKLYCWEWKSSRKLLIFDPEDDSWKTVQMPSTGRSCIKFCFGMLGGMILLFSRDKVSDYKTFSYEPTAEPGSEWQASRIKPSGLCLCSVTITA